MPDTREDIARRRAARQKRIRKRRLIIALIFLLITAVVVGAVMSVTVLFPVTNVTASGSKIYSEAQIVKSSGVNSEDNLFTLTQKEVIRSLQRALPYIDTVSLERSLPGSIHIKVTDAKEYACYKIDDMYYAVSSKGMVLKQYDSPPENTFNIVCGGVTCRIGSPIIFEDENMNALIDELINLLDSHNIKTESIDVTDKYNITVMADGRFEVLLGTESDLDRKIAHLESMIKSIEPERSGKINLSMWTSKKTEGSFTENREE